MNPATFPPAPASGRAVPLQPADYLLAAYAANDLRDRIAASDRALAELDAALDLEHLSRVRLRAVMVGVGANEDRPVIAGNVAFWIGANGEVTSREVETGDDPAEDSHEF